MRMDAKTGFTVMFAIVMLALCFMIFPILLDGAADILAHTSIASFTGLDSVVGISPTLIFIVMVFGSLGVAGYAGISAYKGRSSGGRRSSTTTRY